MSKLASAYRALPHDRRAVAAIACALIAAVAITLPLVGATFARYTTQAESPSQARVALFGHDESIDFGNTWAANLKPGDTRTVALSVANAKDGAVSEVAQTYDIEVETAGNLPLTFTLSKDGAAIAEATGKSTSTAASKTHVFETDGMAFSAATAETHDYTLTVAWPSDKDAVSYADMPDYVQVDINVKQTD